MLHNYMMALLCGIICLGNSEPAIRPERPSGVQPPGLPPLETFVLEPMDSECVSIWVPADRSGPIVNRACGMRRGCLYSCLLPAGVNHTKSSACPDAVARLVAEYVAPRHEEHLPLTITDGWRWEYLYSLSRYESATYDLPARGGSWDYALEAILSLSEATSSPLWIRVDDAPEGAANAQVDRMQSTIEVFGFSLVRPRDGYPKMQMF